MIEEELQSKQVSEIDSASPFQAFSFHSLVPSLLDNGDPIVASLENLYILRRLSGSISSTAADVTLRCPCRKTKKTWKRFQPS